MFKKMVLSVVAVALASAPLVAGSNGSIVGNYVEARTAEVFVGACQLGNEGESAGRQAVMAWRVTQGSYEGITLDGLSIVAGRGGEHESRLVGTRWPETCGREGRRDD